MNLPIKAKSRMKIKDIKVIVCNPGRNFVTVKIETDCGVVGIGDATVNGRELAVKALLEEHVIPCAILYPDAASQYAVLGNKAADAVYLVFTRNVMPVGTVGLLMAGLFAASMSSMDSALNKNAGIFIRSLYQPFLTARGIEKSDKDLLRLSMLFSLISGMVVIGVALFFKSLKELSLFDLMMSVSSMVQVPLLVPLILGVIIKKTPSWAPWATVLVGLAVSWLVKNIVTPDKVSELLGISTFTAREAADMTLIFTLAGQVFVTGGFFCSTRLFYDVGKDSYREQREVFFNDINTPVVADEVQSQYDQEQRKKLGAMLLVMGAGLVLMTLIPNPLWGRLVFLVCALSIAAAGTALMKSASD